MFRDQLIKIETEIQENIGTIISSSNSFLASVEGSSMGATYEDEIRMAAKRLTRILALKRILVALEREKDNHDKFLEGFNLDD